MTTSSISDRQITNKDLAYDAISHSWENFISNYDTTRRKEVLIQDFLGQPLLAGKDCLDGGCGLGYFSKALLEYGAKRVVAIDIAPKLVESLKGISPQLEPRVGDLLNLKPALGQEQFDVVVSSEAIEHTPNPRQAVHELCAHVKAGGYLALSVPNRRWIWLLRIAEFLRVRRPYYGFENWVYPQDLINWIENEGLKIEIAQGVHTVPWQFLPKSWLRKLDCRLASSNYKYSLNLAILAKKP